MILDFLNHKINGLTLTAACGSDKGLKRPENEDNFYFDGMYLEVESNGTDHCLTLEKNIDGYTLLAVFDGMGGGDYGEVASFEAACRAYDYMESGKIIPVDITPSLTDMCNEMNRRVYDRGINLGAYMMGSTIASLFFYSNRFWVCNIGDSRVYGFRNGRINQLSSDHTDEVLMKEQGITGRKPHLTQYLGIDPHELCLEPFIKSYRYEEGDRFLICSDGVTDMVDENLITEIVNRSSTPEIAVQRLIKEAKNNGGKDNITAIVCFVS